MANILQVNKYITINGGSESVMNDLGILLTERGNTVTSIGFSKPNQTLIRNSIIIGPEHQSPTTFFRNSKIVNSVVNEAKRLNTDFMIFHNIYHHFPVYQLVAAISNELKHVKKILYLHDYKPVCPIYTMMRDLKKCSVCKNKRFYNCIRYLCKSQSIVQSALLMLDSYYNNKIHDFYSFFDVIISPSKYLKNVLIEAGFTHKIEVLTNFLPKTTAQVEIKSSKRPSIVFSGRLSDEKGIRILLECIKKTPEITYDIVGTGPLSKEVDVQVKDFQNVNVLGWQTREEVMAILANAKYMILPAIWNENCPLSIIEAFSIGIPVLGSNRGGIPELIGDDRGFLFDPKNIDDVIVTIRNAMILPDEQYNIMSSNCLAFAKNNSSENYYKKLLEIIPEIVNS